MEEIRQIQDVCLSKTDASVKMFITVTEIYFELQYIFQLDEDIHVILLFFFFFLV